MAWMITAYLVGGLIVLIAGAELLVSSAARLATSLGISSLIVGLTVVAFGTSSPELAVSVVSAYKGQAAIAIGNVVGSNVANIAAILGLVSVVSPFAVHRQIVRIEVPIMIGASAVLWLMSLNGVVHRWEGLVLVLGLLGYIAFQVLMARRGKPLAVEIPIAPLPLPRRSRIGDHPIACLCLGAVGLLMLTYGSRWFVQGAVDLSLLLGVDERVVGLTVVAVGTSLPELATSIVAAIRKERDIAVGNVVGSNIFNIMAVLGCTALLAPTPGLPVASELLRIDIPFMFFLAVASALVCYTESKVSRWEGAIFLLYYSAYIGYLALSAVTSRVLHQYEFVLLFVVAPLTAVAFAISFFKETKALVSNRGGGLVHTVVLSGRDEQYKK